MMLFASFDDQGHPAHVREAWQGVEGMEPLPEGMTLADAARLRRVDGKWLPRLPPPEPTPDEVARTIADDLAARRADREAAIQAALDMETPLLVAEMIEDGHPPEWLKARRQAIRDRFGAVGLP